MLCTYYVEELIGMEYGMGCLEHRLRNAMIEICVPIHRLIQSD